MKLQNNNNNKNNNKINNNLFQNVDSCFLFLKDLETK